MMKTLKCLVFVFAMLFRIASKYKVTESIFWTAIVSAMIGFRQDSPNIEFLFVLLWIHWSEIIKERWLEGGFLELIWVPILLCDIVIPAKCRECLMPKLHILFKNKKLEDGLHNLGNYACVCLDIFGMKCVQFNFATWLSDYHPFLVTFPDRMIQSCIKWDFKLTHEIWINISATGAHGCHSNDFAVAGDTIGCHGDHLWCHTIKNQAVLA